LHDEACIQAKVNEGTLPLILDSGLRKPPRGIAVEGSACLAAATRDTYPLGHTLDVCPRELRRLAISSSLVP
jgi:hypothetical protein